MKTLTDSQINRLIEDINTIKAVLAKSKSSIQLLFLPVHFRFMSLAFGLSVIAIAGYYQALMYTYGNYDAVPEPYRIALFAIIAVDWAILALIKLLGWKRSMARLDPQYNFKRMVFEVFTFNMVHFYIIFFVTLVFFVVYWAVTGREYAIIPTLCIGTGLLYNFIGNITELQHYIVMGCWMLVCGMVFVMVDTIPGAVAIGISFGLGAIIFAVHGYLIAPPAEA